MYRCHRQELKQLTLKCLTNVWPLGWNRDAPWCALSEGYIYGWWAKSCNDYHRRFTDCIQDSTASRLLRPYGHNTVSWSNGVHVQEGMHVQITVLFPYIVSPAVEMNECCSAASGSTVRESASPQPKQDGVKQYFVPTVFVRSQSLPSIATIGIFTTQ